MLFIRCDHLTIARAIYLFVDNDRYDLLSAPHYQATMKACASIPKPTSKCPLPPPKGRERQGGHFAMSFRLTQSQFRTLTGV